jgi:hypothetical protein
LSARAPGAARRKLEPASAASHDPVVLVRNANSGDVGFVGDLSGAVFTLYGDYRTLLRSGSGRRG